jgi:hypothetical protein
MKNDGGPAFPTGYNMSTGDGSAKPAVPCWGVSMRDYFAAAALTGAMTTASGLGTVPKADRDKAFAEVAGLLYEVADAMLAERAK